MLPPEYFDTASEDIIKLYSQLEETVIRDITRRIIKTGKVTDSAAWQAMRLQESGFLYNDIIKAVSDLMGTSDKLLNKMFTDGGVKAISYDSAIYKAAGLTPLTLFQSPSAMALLKSMLKKTSGNIKNLTLTTACTSQSAFINACSLSELQIDSGTFDYVTAIKQAVINVSNTGTTVQYPSGHIDRLDVAIRRASLTGMTQTAGKLTEQYADQMGCDLVETTAHIGARPSHAVWQGQVFSRSGKNSKYPDFISNTLYGEGEGLCGWNCRHSFYPYFEGLSSSAYPKSKIDEYNKRTVTYNDKKINYYDATQSQRLMEREIRKTKRELCSLDECMKSSDEQIRNAVKENFDNTSVKLKKQEQKLNDFLHQTGLDRQREREQVLGFNKSVSNKAVWSNKKSIEKSKDSDIIIKNSVDGEKIFTLSKHTFDRKNERNVEIDNIKNALTNPIHIGDIVVDKLGRRSQRYIGEKATVNINPDTNVIVTTWNTGKSTVKKYKKKDDNSV